MRAGVFEENGERQVKNTHTVESCLATSIPWPQGPGNFPRVNLHGNGRKGSPSNYPPTPDNFRKMEIHRSTSAKPHGNFPYPPPLTISPGGGDNFQGVGSMKRRKKTKMMREVLRAVSGQTFQNQIVAENHNAQTMGRGMGPR